MKIRTVDSKNRVTVSAKDGVIYSEHVDPDGTITLVPVNVPTPPKNDPNMLRAVYVNCGDGRNSIATVMICSRFTSMPELADFVSDLATKHQVPVVVNSGGIGIALVDMLERTFDGQIIQKYLLPTVASNHPAV